MPEKYLSQGRNEGGKGGTIPRAPIHYGGADMLLGRRMTAGGAEKSQQCHKYFLQYSKFSFERTPVRPRGRQICFLPRAPSNLVTPLTSVKPLAASYFLVYGPGVTRSDFRV